MLAVAFAVITYFVFARGLGLSLPAGWLAGIDSMDSLNALWDGFGVALSARGVLWGLAGVTLGTLVGVLPGIGPALTIALLLPLTYSIDATAAFIMFAGIYYGAMYGGSTTAILLNTPGESGSIDVGDRRTQDGQERAAAAPRSRLPPLVRSSPERSAPRR